jgi:hypothetical protein
MNIVDLETSPKTGGTTNINGSGVYYFPNANPLTFQGSPTDNAAHCTEVIAASIQFSGTPNLDNTGCPSNIVPTSKFVVLEQ